MNGWITIGTKLETKQFDKQIQKLEREIADYEDTLKIADELKLNTSDIEDLELKIEKAKNSLMSLKKQQMQVNDIGFNEASDGLDKISNKTSSIIKKVGKWALAVFSVRSAYMFVQRASSTLAQYDEQYATNLEYIRFVLAQMIAPVLQGIVNLAFRLLSYINAIANAWFGINLFSKAGVKNFNKMAGAAASIKKSLQTAGFDEMNVLSDTSGGGGAGGGTPSMDLSQMQGEIPSWIQWIADNKETVLKFLATAGVLIAGLKLAGTVVDLVAIGEALSKVWAFIQPLFTFIASNMSVIAGIAGVLVGLALTVKGIVDYLKEPTWENFGTILLGIGVIAAGVLLIFGGFPALITLIIGAIVALGVAIYKNWDKVWEFIKAVWDTIWSMTKTNLSVLYGMFVTAVSLIITPFDAAATSIIDFFKGVITFFKGFFKTLKSLFNGDIKGVFTGFKTMFKGIMDSLWSIAKAPLNLIIGGFNSLIKGANKIRFNVPDWVPGLGGKVFGFNIPQIPKLATGGIVNMPGRGVPIGGAIAGEVSKEGVIPLTNSQAMQELGETIGRYITINANITNSMNGRVISRQLQQIRANQDFAYNT